MMRRYEYIGEDRVSFLKKGTFWILKRLDNNDGAWFTSDIHKEFTFWLPFSHMKEL